MSDKITIPFDGLKDSEVDTTGSFMNINYETLRFLLGKECRIGKGERITGLVITNDSIKIRIDSPVTNQ
jgi:hypothetical protein